MKTLPLLDEIQQPQLWNKIWSFYWLLFTTDQSFSIVFCFQFSLPFTLPFTIERTLSKKRMMKNFIKKDSFIWICVTWNEKVCLYPKEGDFCSLSSTSKRQSVFIFPPIISLDDESTLGGNEKLWLMFLNTRTKREQFFLIKNIIQTLKKWTFGPFYVSHILRIWKSLFAFFAFYCSPVSFFCKPTFLPLKKCS